MNPQQTGRLRFSPVVTATGIDHVRLAYDYLDSDDVDGYGSLLDENVSLDRPDTPPARGRAEVLRMHLDRVVPRARHRIDRIVAEGDSVVAVGRLSPEPGTRAYGVRADIRGDMRADIRGDVRGIGFVDVFTLSDAGMLLGCRRYYFTSPD